MKHERMTMPSVQRALQEPLHHPCKVTLPQVDEDSYKRQLTRGLSLYILHFRSAVPLSYIDGYQEVKPDQVGRGGVAIETLGAVEDV
jgi:hypothetical protein